MTSRVGILFDGQDRVSGTISRIKSGLTSLNDSVSPLNAALTGGIVGGAAVLGFQALGQAIEATVATATEAAQVERLRESFEGLAESVGVSADTILSRMQAASRGTVSAQDLMLGANKAFALGVATSVEDLEGLLQTADKLGRRMGLPLTQAFGDIVTGLGRMSPLILDNLGLSIKLETVYERYAASLGITAAQLDETQKKQALVNAVFAEAEKIKSPAADSAESFERMNAALQDAKMALGELFAPAIAVIAEQLAEAVGGVTAALKDSRAAAAEADLYATGDSVQRLAKHYRALQDEIDLSGIVFQHTDDELRDLKNNAEVTFAALENAARRYNEAATIKGVPLIDMELLKQGIADTVDLAAAQTQAAQATSEASATSVAAYNAAAQALADYFAVAQQYERDAQAIRLTGDPAEIAQAEQVIGEVRAELVRLGEAYNAQAAAAGQPLIDVGALRQGTLAVEGAKQGLDLFTLAEEAAARTMPQVTEAMRAQAAEATRLKAALDGFEGRVENFFLGMAGELGGFAAGVGSTELIAEINRERERMIRQGYDEKTIQFQLEELYQRRTQGILDLRKEEEKATEAALKLGDAQAKAFDSSVSSAISSLQGAVGSVLGEATSLDVGVNPADFMPREDAVNEDARRLADVMVNGFKSPWAAYFEKEFPELWSELTAGGDIQAAAARVLADFQAGLRPELIDRDAVKERVKRMLVGDANMTELANELTAELLGELSGQTPEQVGQAVSQALGLGTADSTATADGILGQFSARSFLDSLKSAGGRAATTWGDAFMITFPDYQQAIVSMLATLVTPVVQANINANASQQNSR